MKKVFWAAVLAALLIVNRTSFAQTPDDGTVAFGTKVSVSSLVSALQSSGYQALLSRPPNAPEAMLGMISTGVGGAKVGIYVGKCDKSPTDDVCFLSFITVFNDEKNIIDEKTLEVLNKKASFAKVNRVQLPNGKPAFNIVYVYVCKDYTDTKFLTNVLQLFASDVGKVATAYNSGQLTQ